MEILGEMAMPGVLLRGAPDPELNDQSALMVNACQIMGTSAAVHCGVELLYDPVRVLSRDERTSTRHG